MHLYLETSAVDGTLKVSKRALDRLVPIVVERGVPRYAQVANDLIVRIMGGQIPIGSLLPKEIDLSVQYGVSRHTIREALRQLLEAGMVLRRRRAGTTVVAAAPISTYRQPTNSIDDLVQYGLDTRMSVRSMQWTKCDAAIAHVLECEQGREWLRVETTRTRPSDLLPICITTIYLDRELERVESELKRSARAISAIIESAYGARICEIDQSIQAITIDAKAARLLKVKVGSPGLQAIRRYYDVSHKLLEFAIAVHPGERFVYMTRLKRG